MRKDEIMPLVHIHMKTGKTEAQHQAIFDGIYQALRETFDVPEDDQFMTITEHAGATFRFSPTYMDVDRSGEVVFIQISARNSRTVDQKKALYKRIAERLGEDPGIRPDDVFINLLEGEKENWSFGHGLAQYA